MKKGKLFISLNLLLLCLFLTGCRRNTNDIWEDSKTAGRHLHRSVRALMGKNTNSRQIRSREEFLACSQDNYYQNQDFIPLPDPCESNGIMMRESRIVPPKECPGDAGSSIPGIDAFCDPATDVRFSQIFKNITFEYNSNLVKGNDNLQTVRKIADYMKKNQNTYIFIEGHCCENGPEAYNFALGARRAHAVRNLLISEGVSADNIFTISYGKERPLVLEHHQEAWAKNRRAEFKIYQR